MKISVHDFSTFFFRFSLPFRKRRRSEWKHDKVFRVYFWKPPAKKNRFRETENSSWSLMFHAWWRVSSRFAPAYTECCSCPLPRVPSARLSHVAQQRLGRVLANEQSVRKIVDIARAGVKKHFTWFELLRCVSSAGKRKTEPCSLIFHYKRCVELTSWFCACYLGGGD